MWSKTPAINTCNTREWVGPDINTATRSYGPTAEGWSLWLKRRHVCFEARPIPAKPQTMMAPPFWAWQPRVTTVLHSLYTHVHPPTPPHAAHQRGGQAAHNHTKRFTTCALCQPAVPTPQHQHRRHALHWDTHHSSPSVESMCMCVGRADKAGPFCGTLLIWLAPQGFH